MNCRIMRWVIVIFFFLLGTTSFGQGNLIQNPEFAKDANNDGIPDNWEFRPPSAGAIVPNPNAPGRRCARLEWKEKGEPLLIQFLSLSPDKEYELRYSVKGNPGQAYRVYVEWNTPDGKTWDSAGTDWKGATGSWEKETLSFRYPSGMNPPWVVFQMKAPGTVLFDDVSCLSLSANKATVPMKEGTIYNGGFESIKGNLPEGWELGIGASPHKGDAYSGEYCLNLTNNQQENTVSAYQKGIPTTPEKHYRLSYVVKGGYGGAAKLAEKYTYWIQKALSLSPDKEYELRYSVKGNPGQAYRVYVEWNTPDGKTWDSAGTDWKGATGSWEKETLSFRYPSGMNPPWVVFQMKAPGLVLFSDVAISARNSNGNPAIENFIKNPSFEASTSKDGIPDNWELAVPLTGSVISNPDKPDDRCLKLEWKEGVDVTGFRVFTSWGGAQKDGSTWRTTFNDWQKEVLEFIAPVNTTAGLTITCQINGVGSVLFDNFSLEEIGEEKKESVSDVVLDKPYFRDSFFSTNPEQAIEGFVAVSGNDVKKVKITFNSAAGEEIFTKTFPVAQPKNYFSFPAEKLKTGSYLLKAVCYLKDGSVLEENKRIVTKLAPAPVEVTVREDNLLLVNGEPFFPIGLMDWAPTSWEGLRALNAAGFNLIYTNVNNPLAPNILDKAAACNLKVVCPFFFGGGHLFPLDLSAREQLAWEQHQKEQIELSLEHPALIAYFLADEPMWAGEPLNQLLAAYQFYRKVDPYRPVWLNEAPRGTVENLAKYMKSCDITGVDIYPVPPGGDHSAMEDKTVSCVGKYTDRMRASVADKKPVWMVLQGFAWADLSEARGSIYPTWEETRFMAYNAIIHGATGIIYWGTYSIKDDSFWHTLFRMTSELRAISPVLVSSTVTSAPVKTNNPGIAFIHKSWEGKNYVLAANETQETIDARFESLFTGKELKVLFENRTLPITSGSFTDRFGPNEVHVYTDGRLLLPEPTDQISPVSVRKYTDTEELLIKSPYEGNASWIWSPGRSKVGASRSFLRRSFSITESIKEAKLIITADDFFTCYINGKKIAGEEDGRGWSIATQYDITNLLTTGENLIAVEARDGGVPPCGFLADLKVITTSGKQISIISDDTWLVSAEVEYPGWNEAGFKDADWTHAEIVADPPWRKLSFVSDSIHQFKPTGK